MQKTSIHQTKKSNRPWYFLFGLAGIVIFAQLIVTNVLAVQGEEAAMLEQRKAGLLQENRNLREQLSAQGSILHISQKATGLGLTKSPDVVWVDLSAPVASLE